MADASPTLTSSPQTSFIICDEPLQDVRVGPGDRWHTRWNILPSRVGHRLEILTAQQITAPASCGLAEIWEFDARIPCA